MLVRKHALSELQPLIVTITVLQHRGEKVTTTFTQGAFHAKARTFLLISGKAQTVSTSWRARTEKSDKHRQPVADPDQAFGGRQKCPHLLKYQRLSATIVVCHTKEAIFCRSKSGCFCWSNHAILQVITTVWKRFISLIQKTFETGPKQWASFFTCYTDFVHI